MKHFMRDFVSFPDMGLALEPLQILCDLQIVSHSVSRMPANYLGILRQVILKKPVQPSLRSTLTKNFEVMRVAVEWVSLSHVGDDSNSKFANRPSKVTNKFFTMFNLCFYFVITFHKPITKISLGNREAWLS